MSFYFYRKCYPFLNQPLKEDWNGGRVKNEVYDIIKKKLQDNGIRPLDTDFLVRWNNIKEKLELTSITREKVCEIKDADIEKWSGMQTLIYSFHSWTSEEDQLILSYCTKKERNGKTSYSLSAANLGQLKEKFALDGLFFSDNAIRSRLVRLKQPGEKKRAARLHSDLSKSIKPQESQPAKEPMWTEAAYLTFLTYVFDHLNENWNDGEIKKEIFSKTGIKTGLDDKQLQNKWHLIKKAIKLSYWPISQENLGLFTKEIIQQIAKELSEKKQPWTKEEDNILLIACQGKELTDETYLEACKNGLQRGPLAAKSRLKRLIKQHSKHVTEELEPIINELEKQANQVMQD